MLFRSVPFEVYAFRDCGAENPFSYMNKDNVMGVNAVVLRNFLSSRMNIEEMNFAMTMLWCIGHGSNVESDGLGGTPLNEALLIAPEVVKNLLLRTNLKLQM